MCWQLAGRRCVYDRAEENPDAGQRLLERDRPANQYNDASNVEALTSSPRRLISITNNND